MKRKDDVRGIRVEIPADVLESVFEECDRHDRDETGGRMVGHFAMDRGTLVVRVNGMIEPGPNARRTPTSFFQDGDHQTKVFRRLEARDPAIEHLGNWHTHHVNGYPTLSAGDVATYRRIVNHKLHNLDFFYALLVTRRRGGKTGLERYAVRHYVLFRGDDRVREIRSRDVRVTDEPGVWPKNDPASEDLAGVDRAGRDDKLAPLEIRARDQTTLRVLGPSLQPRLSARTGTFFWRGPLPLIDGSETDVKVVEVEAEDGLAYYPIVTPVSGDIAELCETPFKSASEALRALEARMNKEIFESAVRNGGMETMEVLTIYVGQGNFAVARHGGQAIAFDTRWPADQDDDIALKVRRFLARRQLVGIVLTGLDDDHADPNGLDRLLESYTPAWVMYPKYFKNTENAKLVFNVIRKHERRRRNAANPLKRVSVRLDRIESRYLDDLTDEFELELFSPHIEDMDNSNNCSIVLKVEGIGPGGFSYLVTGDTENARWDRIVELFDEALGADVLAAPHHGSKNAAHPGMALAVMPNTVLISAGVENQYGHPDAKAVSMYLRVADHVFQTNVRAGVTLLTRQVGSKYRTQRVA